MTADEAKKITAAAHAVDLGKLQIVLDLWERAIRKAAGEGLNSVRESQLDRVRTPIPAGAYKLARQNLVMQNFDVRSVESGPNEGDFEVSW